MPLIRKADAPTFTTPNAVMVTHAGPSLGSAGLSMWQVQMEPAAAGPVHLIDRDQVYLVTAGSLTILADGAESRALAGRRGHHPGRGDPADPQSGRDRGRRDRLHDGGRPGHAA